LRLLLAARERLLRQARERAGTKMRYPQYTQGDDAVEEDLFHNDEKRSVAVSGERHLWQRYDAHTGRFEALARGPGDDNAGRLVAVDAQRVEVEDASFPV
jgi:hypothetical protein